MHKIFCLVFLLFLPCITFGQDTLVRQKSHRFQVAAKAGASYKYFFGKRYIEPTPYGPSNRNFTDHQYERFTKIPVFGFQGGFLLSLRLFKNLHISSGILFCTREDIFKNNQDTVIKYGNGSGLQNIHNVIKYEYAYQNFEVPLMLIYELKGFGFNAGVNFQVLTYCKATYSYVITKFSYTPYYKFWETSQKTIKSVEWPCTVIPTFQVNYGIRIKKFTIKPYLGIDFSTMKSFYLHGGMIIPLF